MGRFYKKNAKIDFFQSLATSGRHNSAMIKVCRKLMICKLYDSDVLSNKAKQYFVNLAVTGGATGFV